MDNKKLNNYIVTIDDLGMDLTRDQAAIALVKQGTIDRVAIVVSLGDCAYIKKELEGIAVKKDIHLNVTQSGTYGHVSEPTFIAGLYSRIVFLLGLHFKKSMLQEIAQEWDAQIQKFRSIFGTYPDGINTHEHVHLIPQLFPIAVQLAEKYNIGYMRIGEKPIVSTSDYRVSLLNRWHTKNLPLFLHSKLKTSTSLHSFNWRQMSIDEIKESIESGTELVFHPQYEEDVRFLEGLG